MTNQKQLQRHLSKKNHREVDGWDVSCFLLPLLLCFHNCFCNCLDYKNEISQQWIHTELYNSHPQRNSILAPATTRWPRRERLWLSPASNRATVTRAKHTQHIAKLSTDKLGCETLSFFLRQRVMGHVLCCISWCESQDEKEMREQRKCLKKHRALCALQRAASPYPPL